MLPRYIDNLVLKSVIGKTFKITWNQDNNVTLVAQKGLFKMAKKSKEIRSTIKTIYDIKKRRKERKLLEKESLPKKEEEKMILQNNNFW